MKMRRNRCGGEIYKGELPAAAPFRIINKERRTYKDNFTQ